ncbi:globin domain-containing protein [Rhodococcus sp. OK302]|uniref:globin domain-containing protein n=1 Tax=Rhodococcus sp. OK302 TaxID=1882769 RepID=UPI000B93FDC2|nr:globin domain-containing protein [Rhodococcus sp. OK302]OYD68506.1 NAD(P)H-flavin reductase [Rhodococcus sp. OK302]
MDSRAISLVRSSFKSIVAEEGGPERLARTFYSLLFARSPETREFFPAAMDVQRDRLFTAIGYVVENLDESGEMLEYLAQLGRDHRKYGVTDEHYNDVANSMIEAFELFGGAEMWTEEVDSAWRNTLSVIGAAMTDAANAADGPRAWTATVIESRAVIKGVAIVRLQLDQPMDYRPGQYVSVQVAARPRMWRYLSPANPSDGSGIVEFHIRHVSGGWVSPPMVNQTAVGDTWVIGSPIGALGLPENIRDLLMIGSGTGLAPLRAQILELIRRGNTRRVHLFYSGQYPCDLYDLPFLWTLAEKHSWLTVIPVSEEGSNPWWHTEPEPLPPLGFPERITGKVGKVVTSYGTWSGHDIQLVGNESMVNSTKFRLRAAGIDVATVRSDPTYGVQ